jgi:D-alanine-D-alanine ligase
MAGSTGAAGVTAAAARPIVVVFGGPSAEHDVSILSGTAIAQALREAGRTVDQRFIDLDGRWWRLPPDHRRDGRPGSAYDDPASLGGRGPQSVGTVIDELAAEDPSPVVFVALHGPFGEDGRIQALLETAGIAYTGPGVAASALGMDKALFKRLCRGLGLPLVDWREVSAERWRRERDSVLAELEAFAAGRGDPRLMIKPARLGSSVGMTLAHEAGERGPALDLAFRYDTLVLAEAYLAGARDLEVSVIGNDPTSLELFGPGEIIAGHEFYDFEAKYTPGLSETTTRAEIPETARRTILKIARDAYRAIGGEGFSRVDFLVQGEAIYLSEINTIPGFTPISLFPTMPAQGGYDFAAVCLRIVELAVERHANRVSTRLAPEDLPR